MGELAVLLREPAHRERLRLHGGVFWYEDFVDLGEDMIALKRAFPEIRLLSADEPKRLIMGYVGLLLVPDEGPLELSIELRMTWLNFRGWLQANARNPARNLVVELLRTSVGRRRIIQHFEECAWARDQQPMWVPKPSEFEPAAEPESYRRTLWARLDEDLV